MPVPSVSEDGLLRRRVETYLKWDRDGVGELARPIVLDIQARLILERIASQAMMDEERSSSDPISFGKARSHGRDFDTIVNRSGVSRRRCGQLWRQVEGEREFVFAGRKGVSVTAGR